MMQQPHHAPQSQGMAAIPNFHLGPSQQPPVAPDQNDASEPANLAEETTGRRSKKRKTTPAAATGSATDDGQDSPDPQTASPPEPPHPQLTHPHHPGLHPSFQFQVPPGYMPVMPVPVGAPIPQPQSPESAAAAAANGGRLLNNSKRAEQNRKAQRAFRERRDAHVKALESRSQLLDAALASVEEANRRWEESRQLVETLRMENAQLRAALNAYQQAGAAVAQMQHQMATQHQQLQQPAPSPPEDAQSTQNEGGDQESEQAEAAS